MIPAWCPLCCEKTDDAIRLAERRYICASCHGRLPWRDERPADDPIGDDLER